MCTVMYKSTRGKFDHNAKTWKWTCPVIKKKIAIQSWQNLVQQENALTRSAYINLDRYQMHKVEWECK